MRKSPGTTNSFLELFIYKNRLQLAATDVLYSDGDKYLPAVEVCSHFKEYLRYAKSVLVLGGGLGSMVDILERRGYNPQYTLVEQDKVVLEWALEFAPEKAIKRITPVCEDAEKFMQRNRAEYNLIFVDVFNGKSVPKFVFTLKFLQQCMDSLAQGGHIAFNYIVHDKQEWHDIQKIFSAVFPNHKVISRGVNKILLV